MERTSFIRGETPVILVAPYGSDHENTDYIVEKTAKIFGAYAIINRGWAKSREIDYQRDLADCNNLGHLHEDVLKEEFLKPILRCAARIKKKYEDKVFMLIIMGCDDETRQQANDPDLDMIVGFGDGNPPSFSCRPRMKNAFVHYLQRENFGVYEARPGSRHSGKSKYSLNQLFVRWYPDKNVNSLQLKITQELRTDSELIDLTVDGLVSSIDSLMLFDDTVNLTPAEIKKI